MAPSRDVTRARVYTYEPASSSGTRYPIYPQDPVYPLVAPLRGDHCKNDLLELPGGRHFTYTSGGIPVIAVPIQCCDALSAIREEDTCWSGGITDYTIARLFNVNNCRAAWNKKVELNYVDDPPSSGYWYGEAEVRSGQTLGLKFWCDSYEAEDSVNKFVLGYTGCASGVNRAGYDCSDPLRINFGQFTASGCCECTNTSEDPQINVYLEANCPETVFARHTYYTSGGTPVFHQPTSCHQYGGETGGCSQMACGITVIISDVTDCTCLAGTYSFNWDVNNWINMAVGSCTGTAQVTITCTNLTDPTTGQLTGYVRLFAFLVCGATDTGSGYVDVDYNELEDLDATISMTVFDPFEDPPPCCNGDITLRLIR